MPQEDFPQVFAELKAILQTFAPLLVVTADTPDDYSLITTTVLKNKQPLGFGAVQIKKNYVSFHLVPLYIYPELLDNISVELKARMQGKACFNFKHSDPLLFAQLAALTQAGVEKFRAEN